jgi:superfamily II DNA or RNA helicase
MLTRLATNTQRNRFVADVIHEYTTHSRRIIVLSERREQLLELERLLCASGGVCVTTKKRGLVDAADAPKFTLGRVVGGTAADLRDRGFEATVLLSTYPYAAEGIDIPRLDTLVMASPGINVEQTVGRILRAHSQKQTPLVVDVKDPFSLFEGMAWKRYRYYCTQKYTVTHEQYNAKK